MNAICEDVMTNLIRYFLTISFTTLFCPHLQTIQACGSAEAAEVLLGNDGVLYFKPTCVGTTSTQKYSVQNQSRIPLRYEWKMTHAEKQMLKVDPPTGVIQPNENQVLANN